MRLALAREFGGGPAYWLDPELDDRLIDTALAVLERQNRKADR